jgi:hypothetical protein
MIEVIAQTIPWYGWVYALGEVFTFLGDIFLGALGLFTYLTML